MFTRQLAPTLAFVAAAIASTTLYAGEPTTHMSPDNPDLEWIACPEFFHADCGIAILRINEDGSNADVFFRYPAGESFVEHWHTSAERIAVLRGTLEVTYEGQPTATVATGEYAYGPAGRKHSGACVGDEDCVLFIAFEQAPDTHPVDSR
ncbi:cupin domain-containing protein [Marinihelvus fidelis]|nr:cupin domain-containing protein [Marinihelvus fidelis]